MSIGKYCIPVVGIFATTVLFATQGAWAASNGKTSLTSGFNSSSGYYGTSSQTNITSIPFIGAYETAYWQLKLSVPYISMTTLGGVIPGLGKGSSKKTTAVTSVTTQSGLGDAVASASYFLFEPSATAPGLDVTAKVKLPTADKDKGLGTGETDYAIQFDFYQSKNRLTVFGSLGRKFLGSSADLPLNDIFYGSVGGSYKFADKTSAALSLDAAQASSATGSNQLELTFSLNHKLDKNKKVQVYLLQGFADGSPDTGYGAMLTFSF